MAATATRYLYLVRHGEATADETALSERGQEQAVLLGRRLLARPLSALYHGPLPRAQQTARLIGNQLASVPMFAAAAAGDYVPYVPLQDELPSEGAEASLRVLASTTAADAEEGRLLAQQAVEQFTGPITGETDRHEVVVTHNFLIAWLVREALSAPRWRWLGLYFGNASLTVIRYAPERAPTVLVYNDMSHLPADLRWTGFPPALQV
jgi:broad specificity phosphatase PhoE